MRLLAALLVGACTPTETPPVEALAPAPPPAVLTAPLVLEHSPSEPSHPLPEGAPGVVVRAPAGVSRQGATVVLYLHGWEGCARAIAADGPVACVDEGPEREGWGLAAHHAAAGTDSVFAVAQLAFDQRSSSPGRFEDPAYAATWWGELRDALAEEGIVVGASIVGVAHSGGYRTLQALMASELPLHAAVFLDGLYGGEEQVARWVASDAGRRVLSLHCGQEATLGPSLRLAERTDGVVEPAEGLAALREQPVVVLHSETHHGDVPAAHLTAVLRTLLP